MTRRKRISDTGEKATDERIQDAAEFYFSLRAEHDVSIRMVAKRHGIPWESLRERIRGRIPRKEAMEKFQKLSLFEEGVIEGYCNTLYGWGWPARIQQIRRMAVELLRDRVRVILEIWERTGTYRSFSAIPV
jgi:hypothetical protein